MELSLSGFIFLFKSSGLSVQNEGAPWGPKPCLLPLWGHRVLQGRALWEPSSVVLLAPALSPLDLCRISDSLVCALLSVCVSPLHLKAFLELWELFLSCSFHMHCFGSLQTGNFLGVVLGRVSPLLKLLAPQAPWRWPGQRSFVICSVSKGWDQVTHLKLGTWLYLVSFSAYSFGFTLWFIRLPVQIRLAASF